MYIYIHIYVYSSFGNFINFSSFGKMCSDPPPNVVSHEPSLTRSFVRLMLTVHNLHVGWPTS